MGNPSIKRLMEGFDQDTIDKTKPHFQDAYEEKYQRGQKRQFEEVFVAVGRRPI